ncbi:MAG: Holliday junction DNA helicase RuvA [Deltaproteobacteria bacterium]|nr:Holliday junction DNA helicase RuvA [Deltaproteobacteria bacterium]
MLGYLDGKLFKKEEDRVIIIVHGVGYEVFVPSIVRLALEGKKAGPDGDEVQLYISYYHGERQPRPMLVGFTNEAEKEFFELFITVGDIGPTKAVRLITLPINEIAKAIEERNARFLVQIKGLGPKLADKIIAHLYGKVGKYALIREALVTEAPIRGKEDVAQQVLEVMVRQLGHKRSEARKMIQDALERVPQAQTPEEIFEEVYRSQRASSETVG